MLYIAFSKNDRIETWVTGRRARNRMVDVLIALVVPAVLMKIGTRVAGFTGALIVTLMILIFALQIHEKSWPALIAAAISIGVGIYLSQRTRRPRM